jgi:nucleoid-associated protein YgaU
MTENVSQVEAQDAPEPQRSAQRPPGFAGGREPFTDSRCWIVSRVDGLNIREDATSESPSDGHLDTGQSLPARCEAVFGERYQSCGGSHWWVPVPYKGRTHYVAWACVDWYTAESAPHPEPPPRTYIVQRGDTLSGIARRFGVSLTALERANPQIADPNRIFPGQVINIP